MIKKVYNYPSWFSSHSLLLIRRQHHICSKSKCSHESKTTNIVANTGKFYIPEHRCFSNDASDTRNSVNSEVYEADPDLKYLLNNNKLWVEKKLSEDPQYFEKIGRPQKPKYLYFGCSDSRVPANEIIGLGPGEVFVHRNVGNLVPGNCLNALSVLEYAVEHLDVRDIMVAGHYDCGAVKASVNKQDLGLIENWVRGIRDVYRLHGAHLDMISDDSERHRRLVELNVIEQCLNIFKTGVVQRKRLATKKSHPFTYPRIHALVFDPKVGVLNKLPINFKQKIGTIRHIYDLY